MAARKRRDSGEKRARRQQTRATIASFAGRFGVADDALAMWCAIMAAEWHIKTERLVEGLRVLDTMPSLGGASLSRVLRESILHMAKCLGLGEAEFQAMMDRGTEKPAEPPHPPEHCPACNHAMVWVPAPIAGGLVQLCPHCQPDAVAMARREQVEA